MLLSFARAAAIGPGFAPSVDAALDKPDSVVLYSLEPWEREDNKGFHSYKVLGTLAPDRGAARTVIAEFRKALAYDSKGAACFDPRHGLRVRSNGHTFDFLLCYDCGAMRVLRDGKAIESHEASGNAAVLNKLLTAAGVALSRTGN